MRRFVRSIDPQLPRDVWLLQIGGVSNSFRNGVVFPFLAIYLHNVRGFGLATAGIAIAISSAAQLVAGVAMGPVIDRLGRARCSPEASSPRRPASACCRSSVSPGTPMRCSRSRSGKRGVLAQPVDPDLAS